MGGSQSKLDDDVEVYAVATDRFSITTASMRGWRRFNEDAHIVELKDGRYIFGVFDGHGGPWVSAYIATAFSDKLRHNPVFEKAIPIALRQTFCGLDKDLQGGFPIGPHVFKAITAAEEAHNQGLLTANVNNGPHNDDGIIAPTEAVRSNSKEKDKDDKRYIAPPSDKERGSRRGSASEGSGSDTERSHHHRWRRSTRRDSKDDRCASGSRREKSEQRSQEGSSTHASNIVSPRTGRRHRMFRSNVTSPAVISKQVSEEIQVGITEIDEITDTLVSAPTATDIDSDTEVDHIDTKQDPESGTSSPTKPTEASPFDPEVDVTEVVEVHIRNTDIEQQDQENSAHAKDTDEILTTPCTPSPPDVQPLTISHSHIFRKRCDPYYKCSDCGCPDNAFGKNTIKVVPGSQSKKQTAESLPFPLSSSRDIANVSGSTAVVVLVDENTMHVAHAGDSRALLCRSPSVEEIARVQDMVDTAFPSPDPIAEGSRQSEKDKRTAAKKCDERANAYHELIVKAHEVVSLTRDHSPSDPGELERIQAANGYVSASGRVMDNLNLTRAIGDLMFKRPATYPVEKQMITPYPDVSTFQLTKDDEFLMVACDGIFEVLDNTQIALFVLESLRLGSSTEQVLRRLFRGLLSPDPSRHGWGCDNMSTIFIDLKPFARCPSSDTCHCHAEQLNDHRSRFAS